VSHAILRADRLEHRKTKNQHEIAQGQRATAMAAK